ncbi:MAG: hypothetical protein R3C03_14965 [Pirellulaceae bacterium]
MFANCPRTVSRIVFCLFIAMALGDASAFGQNKGIRLPFGRKSEKNVQAESLSLTESAGPWLIMCTSFVGESAEIRAEQLAKLLAEELRVPVYVYKHDFDFSKNYEGMWYSSKEWDVDDNGNAIAKRKPTRTLNDSSFEEVAVLVGDFPSVEDGGCQRMLEKIKYLKISKAAFVEDSADGRNVHEWRENIKFLSKDNRKKGPLGSAFVMPNPMIPEEYFRQSTVDTTILKINRNAEFSLLDCPGNYTIRVATFRGAATFNLDEIEQENKKMNWLAQIGKPIENSKLNEASRKANLLCGELRKLGVEAYEFHDRSESYVCVGNFEWVSRDDGAGGVEFNPEVEDMILLFKGSIEEMPRQGNGMVAKSLPSLEGKGILFDVQPVPVAVPRDNSQQTARGGILGMGRNLK